MTPTTRQALAHLHGAHIVRTLTRHVDAAGGPTALLLELDDRTIVSIGVHLADLTAEGGAITVAELELRIVDVVHGAWSSIDGPDVHFIGTTALPRRRAHTLAGAARARVLRLTRGLRR